MRFPKSDVQVRECGIALDIFYPVISVTQMRHGFPRTRMPVPIFL